MISKKYFTGLAIFMCTSLFSFAQKNYWQQQVNFKIDVTLNDTARSLSGICAMEYKNNSADTLTYLWMHLWPNAYKNDRTAFSEQLLRNGNTSFYFADAADRGYISQLNFKVDGLNSVLEFDTLNPDVARLLLPQPLLPGQTINVSTPFFVQLPKLYSRLGYEKGSFHITQWYPKPAVYDAQGWHPMPYLDQGEFYSEFGNFSVTITTPAGYVVAASGKLQQTNTATGSKTETYQLNNAHDFAWFTSKNFVLKSDSVVIDGKKILVQNYVLPQHESAWRNSIEYTKKAITIKSNWLGAYPYEVITVVDDVASSGSGMEYPTITVLGAPGGGSQLESLINHEVGHNWFYGILASNERVYPWMDEGMNSYYDAKYEQIYTNDAKRNVTGFVGKRLPVNAEDLLLGTIIKTKNDQPVNTAAVNFSAINYSLVAYRKAALWMQHLENKVGSKTMEQIMQKYYADWQFKHPYPADFKQVAEQVSGMNLDKEFALLDATGFLQTQPAKKIRPAFLFNFNGADSVHYISLAPAFGYNFYDKFMAGVLVHNYNLPPSNVQFIAAPLFATGSKKINGYARVALTIFRGNFHQKLSAGGEFAKFTGDDFTQPDGKKVAQPFRKIAPFISYTFGNKTAASTMLKKLTFTSYFIEETNLSFQRDTVLQQDVFNYPKVNSSIQELEFFVADYRALYPYHAMLQVQRGEGFVRASATAKYFFNYAKGGGLNVRLFAGKFMYPQGKTSVSGFYTGRYQLNLSGPNGYEDYTYRNYFFGRNEFQGFVSHQMMIRDGAFKVRTELLSSKIGKTDNWLTAVNLTSDIPKSINPLSLLPVKIPLKVFVDIGTYAEAWNNNGTSGRFLFDAGLQLSLFDNCVNIYAPLVYSKVFSNYFKSTVVEKIFVNNLTFSLSLRPKKIAGLLHSAGLL